MKVDELKKISAEIELRKEAVGKERDILRRVYDELLSVIDCFDEAHESLGFAKQSLDEAIEKISEIV